MLVPASNVASPKASLNRVGDMNTSVAECPIKMSVRAYIRVATRHM